MFNVLSIDGTQAFIGCPGQLSHTNPTSENDCVIYFDNVPTVKCFHSSCSEEVEKAKIEAVRQEKIRKEAEEQERIRLAQEAEKKAEHERQMAPDKEKLHLLGQTLAEIKFPEVQSPEAKGILLAAKESIENLMESLFNAKL